MESETRNARFLEEVLSQGPFECQGATVSAVGTATGELYQVVFSTPQGPVVAEVPLYSRVSQKVGDMDIAEWLEQKALTEVQKRRRARRAALKAGVGWG